MGGLFSSTKSKAPVLPRIPSPAAIPELGVEAGEFAARAAGRRSGFLRTIITGALEPPSRKKRLLG